MAKGTVTVSGTAKKKDTFTVAFDETVAAIEKDKESIVKKETNRIINEKIDNGYVTTEEIAAFLKRARSEIEANLDKMRAVLPKRARLNFVADDTGKIGFKIGRLKGKLFAYVTITISRSAGNGWGPSVNQDKEYDYHMPNGIGSMPATKGADLFVIYNNGWDTGGKVIAYYPPKKYTYKAPNGKMYTHKYNNRKLRKDGKVVKYVTRPQKDPTYFINNAVYNALNKFNGITALLNDLLYTIRDGENGIYGSSFNPNGDSLFSDSMEYYGGFKKYALVIPKEEK